jgi:CDP-glucose 4,6-dehydratase
MIDRCDWSSDVCSSDLHEAHWLSLDSGKAHRELDWRPRWRLGEGLSRTVEWHRAWRSGMDMQQASIEQLRAHGAPS